MSHHCSVRSLLCSVVLLCVAVVAEAAPAGSVTPIAQERVVSADGGVPESTLSDDVGVFEHTVRGFTTTVSCLPFGGKCVTFVSQSTAVQTSLIERAADGALEIRAVMSTMQGAGLGGATARSRLTSTFLVDGVVPFVLQATVLPPSGSTSLVLRNEQGVLIEELLALNAPLSRSGQLPAGTYTLTVESLSGPVDVRFTAGGDSGVKPRCVIRMSQPSYRFGEIVVASGLRIDNAVGPTDVAVEFKTWLRPPDGRPLTARNFGADGSAIIPAGGVAEFGPFDVMGVGPEINIGLWEFGCRLLDPTTGKQLDEDSDLFEIQ